MALERTRYHVRATASGWLPWAVRAIRILRRFGYRLSEEQRERLVVWVVARSRFDVKVRPDDQNKYGDKLDASP